MAVKFKKSFIERLVREELSLLIKELWEAEKDDKKEPDVKGADGDNDDVAPDQSGADMAPKVGDEKDDSPEGEEPSVEPAPTGDEDIPDEEVPVGKDPSDTELSKDVEDEPEEPGEEEPEGGDISDEIAGRSIQSITVDPESKVMPGAQEIVLQFEEIPHPLRILVGKSGMIKYFWRGSLHNKL